MTEYAAAWLEDHEPDASELSWLGERVKVQVSKGVSEVSDK